MNPSLNHTVRPVSEQLLLLRYAAMLALLVLLTTLGISMAGAASFSDENNADLFGRVVVDVGDDDAELSAFRIGVKKPFTEKLSGKFEVDFSHDVVEIDNAYLAFGRKKQLRIGTQKLIRSFSAATSSLHSSFVSRPALFRLTGGLQRDVGIHGHFERANMLIQPAFFLTDGDSDYTAAIRSVYRKELQGGHAWHIGASVHSSPEQEVGPENLAASQNRNDRELMIGAEGLVKQKNWYVATEALVRTTGQRQLSGFYADAGLIFGGEMRYSHRKAALTGRQVNRPLSSDGPGALEIAVRHEQIQTKFFAAETDTHIRSALSLIWYPEEQVRLIVGKQFIHNNGTQFDDEPQEFQARLQVSF